MTSPKESGSERCGTSEHPAQLVARVAKEMRKLGILRVRFRDMDCWGCANCEVEIEMGPVPPRKHQRVAEKVEDFSVPALDQDETPLALKGVRNRG